MLVPAFVAAATALVLVGDGRDGFWARHAMLASLASGVFLLCFGSFLFDDVVRRRETKRWSEVALLSCHVLADQLTRRIVVSLAAMYGDALEPEPRWMARPDWRTAHADPLSEVHAIPAEKRQIAIFRSRALPSERAPAGELINRERLYVLVADDAWCEFAVAELRLLRQAGRALISEWASVMIVADEPRQLLNHVAELNEQCGYLRQSLERKLQASFIGAEPAPWISDVVRRWQLVDARGRILTNELWRAAGEGHFSFDLPPRLRAVGRKDAMAERDEIGEWRPVEKADPELRVGRW